MKGNNSNRRHWGAFCCGWVMVFLAACSTPESAVEPLTARPPSYSEIDPINDLFSLQLAATPIAPLGLRPSREVVNARIAPVLEDSSYLRDDLLQTGRASWYGERFHGRLTASGERYNMHAMTAAHRTLPFGTEVCVRGLVTGREVLVRINDRGPYAGNRIIDLSRGAAEKLGMVRMGLKDVALWVPSELGPACGEDGMELESLQQK